VVIEELGGVVEYSVEEVETLGVRIEETEGVGMVGIENVGGVVEEIEGVGGMEVAAQFTKSPIFTGEYDSLLAILLPV
jgi:uncharacterized OB-fold protein